MVEYYTKGGKKIYNPAAYAKTGAPMYKSNNSTNINKPTYIYKLNLEHNKKYVGKTTNIDRRMNQHFGGNGSKVTKKFAPKDGEIVDVCNGYFSDKIEQKHTNKYIKKHGYNNVRGGKYTNSKTLHKSNYKKYKKYKNTQYECYDESDDESDDECYDEYYDDDFDY